MSAGQYVIRRATMDDLDVVARLFDRYRVFYEQESDLPAARTFLQERFENDDSVVFVALETDERHADARGLGFTQLYPMFSSVRMKSIWILNDLYVAGHARRRGIGRTLLNTARDFARESGAAGLELATARDNEQAKSVYHDLGWELDTEFDHYSIRV